MLQTNRNLVRRERWLEVLQERNSTGGRPYMWMSSGWSILLVSWRSLRYFLYMMQYIVALKLHKHLLIEIFTLATVQLKCRQYLKMLRVANVGSDRGINNRNFVYRTYSSICIISIDSQLIHMILFNSSCALLL